MKVDLSKIVQNRLSLFLNDKKQQLKLQIINLYNTVQKNSMQDEHLC